MTFDNNVSVGAGSRLQIELGGSPSGTKYDQVRVTGGLSLDGTLSVSLIDGFAPTRGDSFDILDWGSLSGTFHTIQLPALAGELTWNTSQLYVSGRLSVASAGLPGDYNQNSVVDAADFVLWRDNLGSGTSLSNDDTPGVGPDDYTRWRANFGQAGVSSSVASTNAVVPEPTTLAMFVTVLLGCSLASKRQSHQLMR